MPIQHSQMISSKPSLRWLVIFILCSASAGVFYYLSATSHRLFLSGCFLFAVYAIVSGIYAFVGTHGKNGIIKSILMLAVILYSAGIFWGVYAGYLETVRAARAYTLNGYNEMSEIYSRIEHFTNIHHRMPNSATWCDDLLENNPDASRDSFLLPPVADKNIQCSFAWNCNLNGKAPADLPDTMVILFEAEGEWNLAGGEELLRQKRTKDAYFWKKDRFILVCFQDGAFAKYRLADGAIALYSEHMSDFAEYQNKSKYLPLKWNSNKE